VINSKAQPCAAEVIRSTRGSSACPNRDKTWVLAAAVLGSTMAFVDESVVNVALPTIEADLHTTLAAMQWVINAYTLCMSALLLIGGAAADRFGRPRDLSDRHISFNAGLDRLWFRARTPER